MDASILTARSASPVVMLSRDELKTPPPQINEDDDSFGEDL